MPLITKRIYICKDACFRLNCEDFRKTLFSQVVPKVISFNKHMASFKLEPFSDIPLFTELAQACVKV